MNGIQPWAMTLWGRVLSSRRFWLLGSIFFWSLDWISVKTWGYGWWGDSKKSLSPSQTDILAFSQVTLCHFLKICNWVDCLVHFYAWHVVISHSNWQHLFYYCKPVWLIKTWNLTKMGHITTAPIRPGLARYFYPRTFRKSLCNFFSILIQYFLAQNICLCPRNALHKMECTVLTFYVPASPPCCCCCH